MNNLIIQAPDVETRHLKQLARLSNASGIEALTRHPTACQAFLLRGADPQAVAAVSTYCTQAQLDFGFVPASRRIEDFGLVVMDMDSTLITIECIDEIADMVGVKPKVAAITEAAMRGEIDFSESLRRRVRLLEDLPETALERVYRERLELSPGAQTFLAAVKAAGGKTLLVSGGFTFFTDRLRSRLGIDFTASNTLEIEQGMLTGGITGDIVDGDGKAAWLERTRQTLGLDRAQVLAVGDGANDLKMLGAAGVSVAYHAKPVVRERTDYAIHHCGLDAILNLMGS